MTKSNTESARSHVFREIKGFQLHKIRPSNRLNKLGESAGTIYTEWVSVMELSRSTQDFLKVVWAANEWSDAPVTPSQVAKRLRLKLSTVSGTLSRLVNEGMLERSESGSILLTEVGRAHALQMIRRHRLIETFLSETLDFPMERLHDEAEHLEHVASDYLIERIDALLGHPMVRLC